MLRTLPRFLTACILIVTPLVANALGFGNIKLNSALNEPLDAEIGLLSATVDEVSGLKVQMASREAFLRAGVDRPSFLGAFNIEIKSRTDDSFYIHMTSRQPVREPFLNFLLELNWYNGRILREYTVLLDPPGRVVKQPAVIATPEVTQPALIAREPEPALPVEPEAVAEVESAPVPFPVPVPVTIEAETATEPEPVVAEELAVEEPVVPEEQVIEEAALPEPAEAVIEPETIQADSEVLPEPVAVTEDSMLAETAVVSAGVIAFDESSAFSDDTELFPRIPLTEYQEGQAVQYAEAEPLAQGELDYGITRKGDNLWTVAKKLQAGDESVSIYQIMMALLNNNPEAFREGNINRLKIGHVLRIEDPALLQAMSDDEARAAYRIQTEDWENYRQELGAVASADATQPIIAGDLDAPVDMGETETTGELTVAAPGGEELTAGEGLADNGLDGEVATLREELRQLRSDADAMGGTDEALNSQIKELETELADMQRAISIQDTELAAVQQMAAKANEIEEPVSEEAAVEVETAEAEPLVEEVEQAVVATDETVAAALTEEAATEEMASEQAQPEQMPVTELEESVVAEEAVQPAPVVAPVPAPAPVQTKDTGLMATVSGVFAGIAATLSGMMGSMAGDSLLLFIGLPVLLVLIILMVIVIRRRKQAQGGFQESILTGEPASVTADQAEAKEEESSFLSDFAVSGAGAIQAEDSEVDPLTEADVFMAYGRYEAAEERLTEAMENDPSRQELKLKLLELYSATKNQSAFESTAEDFYASLGEDANSNPMWEKVLTMGVELAPNNPLFTGDVVAPAAAENLAEDPGVNLSDSQVMDDNQVMDIGLETGVFQSEDLEPEKEQTSELDFNLDLDSMDDEPEVAETQADEVAEVEAVADKAAFSVDDPASVEDNSLDFNLDLDSGVAEELETESSEPPTAEMEIPEEADSGLDFNLDAGEETATDIPADDADALDLSFSEPAEAAQDDNSDVPDLDFALDVGDDVTDAGSAESDQTMVINLDDADGVVGENDDTSIDLNLDNLEDQDPVSTESEAVASSAEELNDENDETLAIDLGGSLDFDSMDSDGEDTAADLTLDIEEASDAADLDLAAGGDEVGTKLDLARAYIDMGDPEGARSILDEVLDEGNDEQKQDAQQLIQQIA